MQIAWQPFELRPEPTPTLRPEGDYLQSTWQRVVYPMAERMGVPIVLPRVSLAETAVAVSGGRLLSPGWPEERVQHESTLPPRQM